ncbi:MAG: DUF1565 domain-containing protein [Kiritimatiellae bacterium]|nr:DUF1565 domain-containing protein [Kiritimatiellia bacterium]
MTDEFTSGKFYCGKLPKCVLVLGLLASAHAVLAADWFVKADAAVGGDGSQAAPFQTIQEAVDAAAADDTVKVLPGVYDQGSTNAWQVSHSGYTFNQQTRVYVTKKLTILGVGGRDVTTIKGFFGTGKLCSNGNSYYYNMDSVQCMVIGTAAAGTVIRGITFRDGHAHQSAAPKSVAAGGLCSATPSSASDFLVMDSAFVHCFGRGGGGLHGGTAIRCLFLDGQTNWRGGAAYEARLYNCLSYDGNYSGTSLSTWDFCDCIAVNCTVFNNFARGGFYRSSATGFGGTHYNCVSFGNYFTTGWNDLAGYDRGISVNSLSDDRYEAATPAVLDATEEDKIAQLYVSPWTRDFRPVKGGLLDATGERAHLTAFDIPADEIEKDFNGQPLAADATLPIGIRMPVAEVKTGVLRLETQLAVDGVDAASRPILVQSDKYPCEVRLCQSKRMVKVNNQKPIIALQLGSTVRYLGQYPDVWQLLPKVGETFSWNVWVPAAEFYVGGDNASDANDGTSGAPFATIQKAVDAAVVKTQTLVHVRPGTYGCQTGTYGNEPGAMDTDSVNSGLRSSINIPAQKRLFVKSTGGAAVTFIEGAPDPDTQGCGPNATRCLAINNAANVAFSGFTFRRGYAYNNDAVTDQNRSYSAAIYCGGYTYQHIYDSVIAENHGRGVVYRGLFARCLFKDNTDIRSSVAYESYLTACLFARNGAADTAYTLYNRVYAFGCTIWDPLSGGNLQNINGRIVNCAYETWNGRMLNVSGSYYPAIGSVIKARQQTSQDYPDAMLYADPSFTRPSELDFRLQRSSPAVGYGVLGDPYGMTTSTDFLTFLHGDYYNQPLVHEDGLLNAGAVAEIAPDVKVYVDAVHGNDANDGLTEATAKRTLSAAAATVADFAGSVPIVALPGHYADGWAVHVGNSFKNTQSSATVRPEPTVRSRVVVPEGHTLVSRDGPEVTFIEGAADPASTDPKGFGRGSGAIRCVFLERNAVVRGFTICKGRTDYFESGVDGDTYQDDFYGAGVLGRAEQANGNGVLAGSRVENCIITDNYADLGGAGGITSFHNCVVTNNWGVNFGGFFRHGACYNCYVDDCHGSRMCDVLDDCVNCTFGPNNSSTSGGMTEPFANIRSAARVWNFLLLSPTAANIKFGNHVQNIVIPSEVSSPGFGGTAENVNDSLSRTELNALYENGVAKARTAPTVDAGSAEALALLKDGDAVGAARVQNGTVDIGAFEYDWLVDYSLALGDKVTVTQAAQVVEAEGRVTLAHGAEIAIDWTGRSGRHTAYEIAAVLSGTGSLVVMLNGEVLGTLTSSGKLRFANALAVNQLSFAYTGEGSAVLDSLRRPVGFSLTLQ